VIAAFVERIFRGDLNRDGAAADLEAHALGTEAIDEPGPVGAGSGRRQRPLAGPRENLEIVLSQKVLNAWLQNRHQTMFPLTVNLRNLEPARAALLARVAALAALAGIGGAAEALARAESWLRSVGGDESVMRALDDARHHPPALSDVLGSVQDEGVGAYAYVAALIAMEPRDPATTPFLDYLAARLALPTTIVRSARRRYGR
jgi:hypothetical protein